jgi:hypothetical protein
MFRINLWREFLVVLQLAKKTFSVRTDGQPPLTAMRSTVCNLARGLLQMKAIEFQSKVSPDQTLAVPASLMGLIPVAQAVRVLILVPEDEADEGWANVTADEFGRGYADADAVYD